MTIMSMESISNGISAVEVSDSKGVIYPFTRVKSAKIAIDTENQFDITGTTGFLMERFLGAAMGTVEVSCTGQVLSLDAVRSGGKFTEQTGTANRIVVTATRGVALTVTESTSTVAQAGVYAYNGDDSTSTVRVISSANIAIVGTAVTLSSVNLVGTIKVDYEGFISVITTTKRYVYEFGGDTTPPALKIAFGGKINHNGTSRLFSLFVPKLLLDRGCEFMSNANGEPPEGTLTGKMALGLGETSLCRLEVI